MGTNQDDEAEPSDVLGDDADPTVPEETEETEPREEPLSGVSADVEDEITDDEQTVGVLLHISALSGLVVPFGNIFGPLLVWLVKKDDSRFIDESGKEALNFQITWTILMIGALLTVVVGVGVLLVPIIAVAWIILVVIGTIRASNKEVYRYPLTADLII